MGTPLNDYTFDSFHLQGRPDTAAVVRVARNFAKDPQGLVTFFGINGTGKTMALMAITNYLLGQNVGALYMTASDMLGYLKEGFGNPDFNDRDRLLRLRDIPVIMIDEFQMVNWDNGWTDNAITDLINWRYEGNRQEGKSLGTAVAMDMNLTILPMRIRSRLYSGKVVGNRDSDFRIMRHKMEAK